MFFLFLCARRHVVLILFWTLRSGVGRKHVAVAVKAKCTGHEFVEPTASCVFLFLSF